MVIFHSYVKVYQRVYPLVNIQTNRISPFLMGKSTINGPCSIACLPEGITRSWLISPVFAGLMMESTPQRAAEEFLPEPSHVAW